MSLIEDLDPQFLRARVSAKWGSFGEDVVPSNPAEMDFAIAPAIQAALQDLVDRQQYGYTTRGPGSLHDQIAQAFVARMRDKFGWSGADPANITVTNDLVQAVMANIMAFSEPGDGVSLQVPSYPAFLMILKQSGRRTVVNPMVEGPDRWELDIDDLRANADGVRVLLLCHPHNPTGRVFTKAEMAPIAALAEERDMLVISDEIHADLLLDGREHIPFGRMFPELAHRTVTLYSATKSFNIPGLRAAVMHFGTAELKQRFEQKIPPFLLGTPGSPGIVATIAAWRDCEAWCRNLIGVLEANRDHLLDRFARELPGVRIARPEATYLAWADFGPLALSAQPYEYLLKNARVWGGDGRNFGPHYENFVRLNFATSRTILDDKIDRLVRAVHMNSAA